MWSGSCWRERKGRCRRGCCPLSSAMRFYFIIISISTAVVSSFITAATTNSSASLLCGLSCLTGYTSLHQVLLSMLLLLLLPRGHPLSQAVRGRPLSSGSATPDSCSRCSPSSLCRHWCHQTPAAAAALSTPSTALYPPPSRCWNWLMPSRSRRGHATRTCAASTTTVCSTTLEPNHDHPRNTSHLSISGAPTRCSQTYRTSGPRQRCRSPHARLAAASCRSSAHEAACHALMMSNASSAPSPPSSRCTSLFLQ